MDNAAHPELPGIGVTVPDGWSRAEPAEALLAVLAPAPARVFRANVVVNGTRHDAPVDPAAVAAGARRRLAELPGVRLFGQESWTVGGLPGELIRASWVHPEAGTLVQSVLTLPVPAGPVVHVLDVVGTFAAGRIEEDARAVDAVMRSLRAGPAAPAR